MYASTVNKLYYDREAIQHLHPRSTGGKDRGLTRTDSSLFNTTHIILPLPQIIL